MAAVPFFSREDGVSKSFERLLCHGEDGGFVVDDQNAFASTAGRAQIKDDLIGGEAGASVTAGK